MTLLFLLTMYVDRLLSEWDDNLGNEGLHGFGFPLHLLSYSEHWLLVLMGHIGAVRRR